MRSLTPLMCLAALAIPGLAVGVELIDGFVDMRLGYQRIAVGHTERTQGQEIDNDYDVARRFALDYVVSTRLYDWGGLVWNFGGAYNHEKGDLADGSSITVQSWVIKLAVGYGYAFTEHLQIEALPFIGAGRAYLETSLAGVEDEGDSGYWEAGVDTNLVYSWSNHLQVGGTIGLIHSRTDIELDDSDVTHRLISDNLKIGVFIGMRH